MPGTLRGDAVAAARGALPALLRPHTDPARGHRALMRDARRIAALLAADALAASERQAVLGSLVALVGAVRELQTPEGLFRGGDNVESPPDSAFTIGDAGDALALLRGVSEDAGRADADAASPASLAEAAALATATEAIATVMLAAKGALLTGGVHTPNHRWELCSALARIHELFPDPALVTRIDEWLAEGIDIDESGVYSERSPNYAAHVTNPSLVVLARALDRPELLAPVLRNLDATLALIRPDASVETVQSRRQDQGTRFPLADYLAAFRLAAALTGRGDFGAAARLAAAGGIADPDLLAELLRDPRLEQPLGAADETLPLGTRVLPSAGLTVWRDERIETVIAGGSDYAAARRIRSGLANDPTLLRLFAGEVIVDSVRLSRRFFDLGPFRADRVEHDDDGSVRLIERVAAGYYGPLPPEARRVDGLYELGDEGRFSAAMDFTARPRTEVVLETVVTVTPAPDGVDLRISTTGPQVPLCLELVLRDGTTIEGAEPVGDDPSGAGSGERWWALVGDEAVLRRGGAELRIGPGGLPHPAPFSEPGQDYTALGGTDERPGDRLGIVFSSPGEIELRLRRTDRA